jgi:hypothetical protein
VPSESSIVSAGEEIKRKGEEKKKRSRREGEEKEKSPTLSLSPTGTPQLPLLSDGKKKKKRIEEDFGSTDFDVLFVDEFGWFLKIFWVGLV